MTSPAIETHALRRTFGDVVALDDLDLAVPEGSVFGFLGPNGAGKTTTLRILTGLARATSGRAVVLGYEVGPESDARRELGFLPDVPAFYRWMTAREFLTFMGRLFALPARIIDERVGALLDVAGLTDDQRKIGGFSRGMKQRLGIAQAMINAPRVLLLDEPTSALDPIGRRDVLHMLEDLRGRTTVFFSSHILADVERVCDTVAILDRGRIVAQDDVSNLLRRGVSRRITVELVDRAEQVAAHLEGSPWLASIERCEATLSLTVSDREAAQRAVPAAISAVGAGLRRMEMEDRTLEDVFIDLVGEGSP